MDMNEAYLSKTKDTAKNEKQKFMVRTYGWMGLALLISAVSAFFTVSNSALLKLLFSNGAMGFFVLAIVEIGLVIWLSSAIRKISVGAAAIAFIVYAVINGVTLSSIFFVYQLGSIMNVFIVSALMFCGMAVYGALTKQNLASAGRYLIMILWGVLIASLLNIFFKSSKLDWLISLVSVVLFAGLTAYDSQRIYNAAGYASDSEVCKKAAIFGALQLYLDFINIFLSLLRLFGKRR